LASILLLEELKNKPLAMTTIKTIVFGPTGNVGFAAARGAQQHGAKVFLAMRDPRKPIPSLSAEQEAQGGFERVQADLTKPETIAMAVNQTGAKHAFIYVTFGTSDNMRSSIMALKSAGIKFVVFLSSDGIQSDIR
jgi:NAD(P)-dependent dehydrogenase (short-subunit alcohol dehydrogenase family)